MTKNKTLVAVFGLALVSALATLFMSGSFSRISMSMGTGMRGVSQPMMIEDGREINQDMAVSSANSKIAMMPPYYGGDDALEVSERSYEKYGNYSVVVDDVPAYLRGIKEYALSIGGVILNSNMSTSSRYQYGDLYIKVPVEKFDEATSRVTENVEKVVNENISASDITGQVVGTENSVQRLLDQKKLVEARIEEAKTPTEKAKIQIELDSLDRQIEAAERAVTVTEQRVAYATLSVSAADSQRHYEYDGSVDIGDEFSRAWQSLKSSIKLLLTAGIWLVVYAIVWLPVVLIIRKIGDWIRPAQK